MIQRPEYSGKIDILRKVAAQVRIRVAHILGRAGERSEGSGGGMILRMAYSVLVLRKYKQNPEMSQHQR